MKNKPFLLYSIGLFLLINLEAQTGIPFPAGISHVIAISVAGMSPGGIKSAPTPVMGQLIKQAAVKWNCEGHSTHRYYYAGSKTGSLTGSGSAKFQGCPDREETCAVVKIAKPAIYDWIKHGKLKRAKIMSRVYFLGSDIRQLMQA